jgi:protoporphyrinogen oxidase
MMESTAPHTAATPQHAAHDASRTPTCVIIGAGVTGLALALRLGERGGRGLLLEGDTRAGGLAKCLHFKGISSDMGPHRIHTEIPEVARVIEQVAAPSLFKVRRQSHIYLRGKFLKYPPSMLELGLHLGPWAMTRFAASYAAERLRPTRGEETYESLMRKAFGKQLYEFLLRPYSAKTWKIDPAELHADTARVRVSAGSLAKMLRGLLGGGKPGGETALKEFKYVRGGAETLVRHLWEHAAAHGAELRLQTRVERLNLDATQPDGTLLVNDVSLGGGADPVRGDAYASTMPLPLLLTQALPALAPLAETREAARGLEYLDMVFALIIVRRKVITGDNWLYFPEPHLIFNRGYEAKNFDPAMGTEERSVLCLEITHRRDQAPGTLDDETLRATVLAQIVETGLFRREEVEEVVLYRLPWAYPLYTLDYDTRLDKIFKGLRKISNLLTLGRQGMFNHNNMDHSIWMGLRSGDLLGAMPVRQAVERWYDGIGEFKTMRIVD